jgi:hypothetical protein
MPVPSRTDVDLKELAAKWQARLPVWCGDRAEVDVSREVSWAGFCRFSSLLGGELYS